MTAAATRRASESDLLAYAEASGDSNPIHLDEAAAKAAGLDAPVVHGMLVMAWVADVASGEALGRHPRRMRIRFKSPLAVGERAEILVEEGGSRVTVRGGDGRVVASATIDYSEGA